MGYNTDVTPKWQKLLNTILTPFDYLSDKFWIIVSVIFILGLLGLIGSYTYSVVQERLSPADIFIEHDPVALDLERISRNRVDIIDVRHPDDVSIVILSFSLDENTPDEVFISMNQYLADNYSRIRFVPITTITQLGHDVYVIAAAFDCVISSQPEVDGPLLCRRDETIPFGFVLQDEAMPYIGIP